MNNIQQNLDLSFVPLTMAYWHDFESLFGSRGACGGCWCMWFRLPHKTYQQQRGEGNKSAIKSLVESGTIPGILAFHKNTAVGWCSVSKREEYLRLARSRILKPVDEQDVWSVVCFYVAKGYRRKGVSSALLSAAVIFVEDQGGKIVEGYPVEPKKSKMPDTFAYFGLASAFRQAGFLEVARRSETRPIMRYTIPS